MNETTMSEYIKGFDHGCDYIVAEIERYIKEANSHDALVLVDLVKRLKMEGAVYDSPYNS
jgi:hypothetical protein